MKHEQFKRIWIPLSSSFYNVALHFLEDEADAEDAVQDLYVRLWNSKEDLEKVQNPKAYGLTLIRNICIDRIRQKNIRRSEELTEDRTGHITSPPEDIKAIDRESARRLLKAMQMLPQQQRTVMFCRFFKDMDIKDIARQTGLSNVNVRVMITRARSTLKKLLKTENL